MSYWDYLWGTGNSTMVWLALLEEEERAMFTEHFTWWKVSEPVSRQFLSSQGWAGGSSTENGVWKATEAWKGKVYVGTCQSSKWVVENQERKAKDKLCGALYPHSPLDSGFLTFLALKLLDILHGSSEFTWSLVQLKWSKGTSSGFLQQNMLIFVFSSRHSMNFC